MCVCGVWWCSGRVRSDFPWEIYKICSTAKLKLRGGADGGVSISEFSPHRTKTGQLEKSHICLGGEVGGEVGGSGSKDAAGALNP